MPPSFANMYMGRLEQTYLKTQFTNPKLSLLPYPQQRNTLQLISPDEFRVNSCSLDVLTGQCRPIFFT